MHHTERPITVEPGTNVLAGTSKEGILNAYREALKKAKHAAVPPLWDGNAAERIWGVIRSLFPSLLLDFDMPEFYSSTVVGGYIEYTKGDHL